MKALILCAGKGTRLKPITDTLPKCMVEVNGSPILLHIVHALNQAGITEIAVNLHKFPKIVMGYFKDRLIYLTEEEPLGEEETERQLQPWFGDKYVVINGDTLTNMPLSILIDSANDTGLMMWDADKDVYCGYKVVVKGKPIEKFYQKYWWQDCGTPEGLEAARKHYEANLYFGV